MSSIQLHGAKKCYNVTGNNTFNVRFFVKSLPGDDYGNNGPWKKCTQEEIIYEKDDAVK